MYTYVKRSIFLLTFALCAIVSIPSFAATITVPANGLTQTVINNAAAGDILQLNGNQTLTAPLIINKQLTIRGQALSSNRPVTIISLASGNIGRHFTIYSNANLVTFENVVILGKNATYSGGVVTPISSPIGVGGGIEVNASVTLNNCVVAGCCTADASGGAIRSTTSTSGITINNTDISYNRAGYNNEWVSHSDPNLSNSGGGVNVAGPLTLAGVINIVGNMAADNGGGIWKAEAGAVTTTNLTSIKIDKNAAVMGFGGGMYTQASVSLKSATISDNTSADRGGGIMSDRSGNLTLNGTTIISGNKAGYDIINKNFRTGDFSGGGVYAPNSLTLSGSVTLENNSAAYEGGGIWKYSSGSFVVSGLTALTVNNNKAIKGDGGGIYTLASLNLSAVTQVAITNNTSGKDGGGIRSGDGITLTLGAATISGNSATGAGGGVFSGTAVLSNTNIFNNKASTGGGFLSNNTATLTNVTIYNNQASATGGGIYAAVLTLTNSTVRDNAALGNAGGIYNSGVSTLNNSTVSNNKAGYNLATGTWQSFGDGGGIYAGNTITLQGTSKVINNTSVGEGGGIWKNAAGSLLSSNSASFEISGNVSRANVGGGIRSSAPIDFSSATSATITNNTAKSHGGGIYASNATTPITLGDATISGNKAGYDVVEGAWTSSGSGGGIYASSTLTLTGKLIMDGNAAGSQGGGIYKSATNNFTAQTGASLEITNNVARNSHGGGMRLEGTTDLSNATSIFINGNTAWFNGGGISVNGSAISLTLANATISNNKAGYLAGSWNTSTTNGFGGGIHGNAPLTLKGSVTIDRNTSTLDGGGLYQANPLIISGLSSLIVTNNATRAGSGGGLFLSPAMDFSGVQLFVSSNAAKVNGGGIFASEALTLKNAEITKNNAGYDSSNNTWQATGNGGGVYANKALTLTDSAQFEFNGAGANGGAIYKGATGNFDVSNLTAFTVQDNTAKNNNGGGIYTAAPLTLSNKNGVILTLNTAGANGGGIYASAALRLGSLHIPKNTAVNGGGVYTDADFLSYANTFESNSAQNGGGAYLNNTATIINSTFSTNTVTTNGGGIYANNAAHNISFSTFNGNTPSAVYLAAAANQTFNGNILYGNGTQEINTTPDTANYNIVRGMNWGGTNMNVAANKAAEIFTTISSGDIATLADNGGPTPTYNIKRNGIAYNFIPTTLGTSWASTDQRGIARPNTTCKVDAGSVELQETDDVFSFTRTKSLAICNGGTVNLDTLYTTVNIKDTAYYWDAARTQKITSMPVTITTDKSTVYIRFTTTSNCDDEQQLDFIVNPSPDANIDEDSTICNGDEAILSITLDTGKPTPSWSVVLGVFEDGEEKGTITSGFVDKDASTKTITVSPTKTTTYRIKSVTDGNGCVTIYQW